MKVITDETQISEILDRGVLVEFLPDKNKFKEALMSGKKMKFYIGSDPTGSTLHLSHAKNYILLEEFRKLGHEVYVLMGDFTAMIGDPTDKEATRKKLTKEEVKSNVEDWVGQIRPLMDFDDTENPPKIVYNSQWLSPLTFEELIDLTSNFTVQQMMERDMFEKRLKEEKPIYLHEFLYPVMQGYDSVAMDIDVELCGTDQIFNALAGRTLIKRYKNKEKFVIAVNLMENPKTKELMSKSRGTGVFLDSGPNKMYGQIMAQPDEMIEVLLLNLTRIPVIEIRELVATIPPKELKMKAAFEIVSKMYGEKDANAAQNNFEETFSKGGVPEDMKEINTDGVLADILVENKIVESKSEFRRLVDSNAVTVNDEKINDHLFEIKEDSIVRVGKHRFVKIKV